MIQMDNYNVQLESQETKQIDAAIRLVQGEFSGTISTDKTNPHFGSQYTTLPALLSSLIPFLLVNELTITQSGCPLNGANCLVTKLSHSSGEWIKSIFIIPTIDNKPQSLASSTTYLRRMAIKGLIGLGEVDDDGNQASGVQSPQNKSDRPVSGHVTQSMPGVSETVYGTCSNCGKPKKADTFKKCFDCNIAAKSSKYVDKTDVVPN